MLPGRWQEVERLYFSALERDLQSRLQFLAEATADDQELRDEVQSLLQWSSADSRLDRPVWDSYSEGKTVDVAVGALLGPYRIEAFLGAGGMGKVFRARDTRLNRTVAIKFSRQRFTEGFKREACAAAAMNHPNIVQIYEFGSADDCEYIVMEFVPGVTLAELIREKPLTSKDALAHSHQIASALAAAHTAGIVHRDIKPSNIIVNHEAAAVKILDFSLAMLAHPNSPQAPSEGATNIVQGTPYYMSPEQAEGKAVDARSDIFSTGLVLYEMFTGLRAVKGDSTHSILNRVRHSNSMSARSFPPEVPIAIQKIIVRCLERDPARRFDSGQELVKALTESNRPEPLVAFSPRIGAGLAIVIIGTIGTAVWLRYQNQGASWTRNEGLPKIQSLVLQGNYVDAFALTRTALRYAPDDPQIKQHWANVSHALTMTTVPPGATLSLRPLGRADIPWQPVGRTPLEAVPVPLANVRIRIEKDGMESLEFATVTANLQGQKLLLYRTGSVPVGMVPVPNHAPPAGPVKIMELPDYFLDKFEVTNSQFQQFINSGGYLTRKHWKHPFFNDNREIPWQQALSNFHDKTGRTGPATWERGVFAKNRANYPVAGVSWFEAAAYCDAMGKSLPTVYHWQKAAGFGVFSEIVLFSNFTHDEPMRVGENTGITPFGAYDMGGNVKEWAQNEAGGRRAILGGSFNEPGISFYDLDAQDPFLRHPAFGIRCALYPTSIPPSALLPIASTDRDYSTEKPVGNSIYEFIQRMYAYEKAPLLARTESVDDSNEVWRKETVTYAAAYGDERILAYLFLPKNVKPPYQTVLFAPAGYAQFLRNSVTGARTDGFDFLMRNGRAVLFPVYKGTYERHVDHMERPDVYRETMIQLAKDAFRSVDYLEARSDVQISKLGYYGMSLGGDIGPILMAIDPRIKAGVLASGGLNKQKVAPEIDTMNFAPHVRAPILMLGGRYDFTTPLATLQQPMFKLLGTRAQDKHFIQFESGHVPPFGDWMREMLSWLDRYFGPPASDLPVKP